MIKLFDYLFFRVFWWNESIVKEKGMPILSTIIGVALFPYLNLLTLLYTIILLRYDGLPILPKWSIVLIGIFVVVSVYYGLVFKRDYKEIIKENKAYSKKEKTKKDIVIISYIILTFASLVWIIIKGRAFYE